MEIELPFPAAECAVCSRSPIPLAELRLAGLDELFTDSHEGAVLERCELCGTIFLRCWLEVFDDIWRYYAPVSAEERQTLLDAFGAGAAAESRVWNLLRGRPALQVPPGGRNATWVPRPAFVSGPSHDMRSD